MAVSTKQFFKLFNDTKILDIVFLVVSIFVFKPSVIWISKVFMGLYDYFNLFLLIFIIVIIGNRIKWKLNLDFRKIKFQYRLFPLVIIVFAIGLWYWSTFILDINILTATAFFIYIFGVIGFYVNLKSWVNSIIPFFLILMTLPFGNIMDVYIGFPLRILSVDAISTLFSSIGLDSVSSSTIITIENSATQIDFSCSGLKGIWSSLIFFFALTWLDNLKLGINWVLALVVLMTTIIAANIFRIFIIVYLSSVLNLPETADIIHAPLGIIGFVFSCSLVFFIVRSRIYSKGNSSFSLFEFVSNKIKFAGRSNEKRSLILKASLVIVLIIGLIIPPKEYRDIHNPLSISFPAKWKMNPLVFSSEESQFIKEQGSIARKYSFRTDNGISGSIMLIESVGWRGHHNPEYCIRAGGNTIDKLETVLVNNDLPIKWMNVNKNASACYWFQSPTICTDDFGTRVWSEVKKEEDKWILVSVVFHNTQELGIDNSLEFIEQIKELIDFQYKHKI